MRANQHLVAHRGNGSANCHRSSAWDSRNSAATDPCRRQTGRQPPRLAQWCRPSAHRRAHGFPVRPRPGRTGRPPPRWDSPAYAVNPPLNHRTRMPLRSLGSRRRRRSGCQSRRSCQPTPRTDRTDSTRRGWDCRRSDSGTFVLPTRCSWTVQSSNPRSPGLRSPSWSRSSNTVPPSTPSIRPVRCSSA